MREPKPCVRCKGPKPRGNARLCGSCTPLDIVWPRLEESSDGCWVWPGRVSPDGYGCSGKYLLHRVVYEYMVTEVPADLDLDHLCRVKTCVNPWHLEPVTRGENSRRKWEVYTHCKRGHEFTPENTYTDPRGCRNCRACTNKYQRRYQARRKAAMV